MFRLRSSVSLAMALTSVALAQQPAIEDDDATAPIDPDAIAAEEFVREIRRRPREAPVPRFSLEEMFANSSMLFDQLLEQCDLSEPIRMEIEAAEQRLEARLDEDPKPSAEIDEVRSEIMELRTRAYRDCCERSELVCFE